MITEDQKEIVKFLMCPKTYGDNVDKVDMFETHYYTVFIAGDYAYKLKSAVKYPYLDYSTKKKRRMACAREITINKETVPNFYVGVESVVRTKDGSLSLGGKGEELDSLLVMKRFEKNNLFNKLAEDGKLDRDSMYDLAETVSNYYDHSGAVTDRFGSGTLCGILVENDAILHRFIPRVFDVEDVTALSEASFRYFDKVSSLLEERRKKGRVRRGHGDLNFNNISMVDGKPILMNAIEFNDNLVFVDILYDLAFLLMDMESLGLKRLVSIMFNHYMDYAKDLGGLPVLPLFMATRAAIKAHINAQMWQMQKNPADAAELRNNARKFLKLALSYLEPKKPILVATSGFSGSGKSRMSREVAPYLGEAPGAVILRTDVLRKRIKGVLPNVKLSSDSYTEELDKQTYDLLFEETKKALKAGYTVIADGIFAREKDRNGIEQVAKDAGVPFYGFLMEAPLEVMAERVETRKRNPSDATVKVLEQQIKKDVGSITWNRIDTSGERSETINKVRKILGV